MSSNMFMINNSSIKQSVLPAEILGRSIGKLSMVDRIYCERVSPLWKWIVQRFGWTLENKFDQEIVFEGANRYQMKRFTPENLISLLNRLEGPNLAELDLYSFKYAIFQPYAPRIAEALRHFTKLVKLDIANLHLADFVEFLPPTLQVLQILRVFSVQTLEKLSEKCPNLVQVPFRHVERVNYGIVNAFLNEFPRQKALELHGYKFKFTDHSSHVGILSTIGELKELEVLKLENCKGFDERAFEAMSKGCKSLQKFYCHSTIPLNASAVCHLAQMPNLTMLEAWDDTSGAITDSVLKSIARRGLLKRVKISRSDELTDNTIGFLIDQCKSLVSLCLRYCDNITVQTLEAVISEVHRRHGSPPRALPTGPRDEGVFFFDCYSTKIDEEKALVQTADNPWLTLQFPQGYDDPRCRIL